MRMKMNVAVLASLVTLVALVWMAFRTQRTEPKLAVSSPAMVPTMTAQPEPVQPAQIQPAQIQPAQIQPPPSTIVPPVAPLPATVVTQIDSNGAMKHVAQPGETVTSLAGDLLGADSKTNRDAIINANASLKTNPDNLVAGKTYRIPAVSPIPVSPSVVAAPVVADAPATATPQSQAAQPAPPRADTTTTVPPGTSVLKYIAVPGDTVGKMAAAFLGSDDQAHQNAIINANPSLQTDADHVQVGQTYRIPAPDGLSATVGTSPVVPTVRPPHQTDADQVVAAGAARTLKYTARDGDTLGKMALQLLGSDTPENRDLILSKNADLRKDPDHVVSGQTYWIPAPEASADVR